jgi:hypothetical protein
MNAPYFLARWTGEAFDPLGRDRVACLNAFDVGRTYRLTEYQERSAESHNHQFAEIHEAWQNLPDHLRQQFPSPDHLRKHALIRGGYCNSREHVCGSRAEALKLAAFLRPLDEYAIVTVNGPVVTLLTAHSQSKRAMGKARFQASKDACLRFCAELLGTDAQSLSEAAGRAA